MSTARARTRHLVTAAAVTIVTILGVTLSACGADDEPDEGATTASGNPTAEASASSADPTADWKTATDDGGQFLVPPDWDVKDVATGFALQAPPQREGGVRIGRGIFGSSVALDSSTAIDDAAESRVDYDKGAGYDKVERLPDVRLGGVIFYHVRAEDSETWLDDYGTVNNGQMTTVLWHFNRSMVDRKETNEMINQVMSTFKPAS